MRKKELCDIIWYNVRWTSRGMSGGAKLEKLETYNRWYDRKLDAELDN